jgi:uncharacterized protein YndB with AHSA1/START domain
MSLKKLSIKKQILIKAPQEIVFRSLTSSLEIPQYFPIQKVVSDWQVNESIMYFGCVDGEPYIDKGVIDQLEYPHLFTYRYWSSNHGTADHQDNYLSISYQLMEKDRDTVLTVHHSLLKDQLMYKTMDKVWEQLLDSFKQYVERKIASNAKKSITRSRKQK